MIHNASEKLGDNPITGKNMI